MIIALALVGVRWLAQLWLALLNRRHVLLHAGEVPEAFRSSIDSATYVRAVNYSLARNRLHQVEVTSSTVVLALVLLSGWLPDAYQVTLQQTGRSAWAQAGFLFLVGLAFSAVHLPLEWI